MKLCFVLDLFVLSRVGEIGNNVQLALVVHKAHVWGWITSLRCTDYLENKVYALSQCILDNFHDFLSSTDFFSKSTF